MNPRIVFALLMAGMVLSSPAAFAKSFFEQLLESSVGGNSNQNGPSSQEYYGNRQSLREDEQRLDEAYSNLRQKQAAGQDTSAEQAQIQNLELTYRNRRQQVREQEWHLQRQEEMRQRNYQRQQYQQNGYNNGYQQNGYNNGWNDDPYNQNGYNNSNDDGGFKIRFGGN